MAFLLRSRLALKSALQCGGKDASRRIAGEVRTVAHPITECFVRAMSDQRHGLMILGQTLRKQSQLLTIDLESVRCRSKSLQRPDA